MNNQQNTFGTFSTFTTDPSISTGPLAQMDFHRNGKIWVQFHFGHQEIGLSIAGVDSASTFYLFPKNKKQAAINQWFLDRYVLKCHHSAEIIQAINQITKITK